MQTISLGNEGSPRRKSALTVEDLRACSKATKAVASKGSPTPSRHFLPLWWMCISFASLSLSLWAHHSLLGLDSFSSLCGRSANRLVLKRTGGGWIIYHVPLHLKRKWKGFIKTRNAVLRRNILERRRLRYRGFLDRINQI